MKQPNIAIRILDFLTNNPGRRQTGEIAKAIGASVGGTSRQLSELTETGEIKKIKKGVYSNKDDTSSELRDLAGNEKTINILLNIYDEVLASYKTWITENINNNIDFEQRLLFIEHLKALALVVDRLMKRWALVHVGYDTNTQQAQEDAKAKTEERQKEALKDAPLEERITVLGKYDVEAEELIDMIPSSLRERIDEEREKKTTDD